MFRNSERTQAKTSSYVVKRLEAGLSLNWVHKILQ